MTPFFNSLRALSLVSDRFGGVGEGGAAFCFLSSSRENALPEVVGRRAFDESGDAAVRLRICCSSRLSVSSVACQKGRRPLDGLTCDRGSIGERTSCLRLASRPGLGSLLGDEVAFDTVLCNRPGDGWVDEGVTGLPAGMLTLFARVRRALHDFLPRRRPTWSWKEKQRELVDLYFWGMPSSPAQK